MIMTSLSNKTYYEILANAGVKEEEYIAYFPVFEIKPEPSKKTLNLYQDGEKIYTLPDSLKEITYGSFEMIMSGIKLSIISEKCPKGAKVQKLAEKISKSIRGIDIHGDYNIIENKMQFTIFNCVVSEGTMQLKALTVSEDDSVDAMEDKMDAMNLPKFLQHEIIKFLISW